MAVLSIVRRTFQKYPLLANVTIMTSLLSGADITCQMMENKGFANFNWTRVRNMATMGVIYHGPVMFYYYRALDRRLPGRSPRTIVLKLLIDQFAFTVPSIAMFYLLMGGLERKDWPTIQSELRLKWLPTYLTSCLFWPTVQVVNFTFVPPLLRVTYVSSMTFVWMVFLSYIKNRPTLPAIFQRIEHLTLTKEASLADEDSS